MRPAKRYASFVVRLWYADNLEPATGSSEPLRGQITHVQSDHSDSIQNLEEIKPFIQAHLLNSHSRLVTGAGAITVTDGQETSEENVIDNPGGK